MQSINNEVNLLHQTYCVATGIGSDMPMTMLFERWWLSALNSGLTCEDIRIVVADRQRRIKEGIRHRECLLLRNICGSEESIGNVIMEAAYLRALGRLKPICNGKLEVLKATGREPEKPKGDAVPISKVIDEMRKAVG